MNTLELSVEGLRTLGKVGKAHGVRVVTENWFSLLATPAEVDYVLDSLGSDVGFLADSGNWSGPTKYEHLEAIYARAELSHTKASFPGGKLDEADFSRCLDAAAAARYTGPHTLIFADEGDEWAGLDTERQFVRRHATAWAQKSA